MSLDEFLLTHSARWRKRARRRPLDPDEIPTKAMVPAYPAWRRSQFYDHYDQAMTCFQGTFLRITFDLSVNHRPLYQVTLYQWQYESKTGRPIGPQPNSPYLPTTFVDWIGIADFRSDDIAEAERVFAEWQETIPERMMEASL